MASFAARSSQALRAASRRAPRVASQVASKPAQTAAYSLLARSAAAAAPRRTTVEVGVYVAIQVAPLQRSLPERAFFSVVFRLSVG